MSTPTVRRETGPRRGIAYGADSDTEIDFKAPLATFMDNAYSVTRDLNRDEIDVTAFGDFPLKKTEAGFIDISINVSMRKGKIASGALAPDVEFMEAHAISGDPFRIAVIDNRKSLTPNGLLLTVIATQAGDGGDFSAAQDLTYTLKVATGHLPPKRIVNGVATPITFDDEE